MVVKKHFDYGIPDDNPQAISEKICTSRGPPITPEEKKYAGFGYEFDACRSKYDFSGSVGCSSHQTDFDSSLRSLASYLLTM